jgi:hypothetical protein
MTIHETKSGALRLASGEVTVAAVGSGAAIGSTATNWFTGGAASVVRAPINTDLSVEMSGTGRLFFDSNGAAQAWRAGSWSFYSSGTVLGLQIVPGATSTMTGGATSWTLDAAAIINIGTIAATSVKIGRSGQSIGFFATTPIAKPTVTGSRGGNSALQNLLTELANLGLITNSTS